MKNNKNQKELLKEAFGKALEEEISDIRPVGEHHEFSPSFEENMAKTIEKSKTVKFKLSSLRAQRYIAAAISAVFIISSFTVAARITPPKAEKTNLTASTGSKTNSESVQKNESTQSGNSHTLPVGAIPPESTESTVSTTSKTSSSVDSVEPWEGDQPTDGTSSELFAEGFVSSFESVFEAEADEDFVFHSSDRLYHRWNDLQLCGILENAETLSVKLENFTLEYAVAPLSAYPYADAITSLKGEPLDFEADGIENCSLYSINYRSDMQYIIAETKEECYLAKYLKCNDGIAVGRVFEQVFSVGNGEDLTQTAILNLDGTKNTKHILSKEELSLLYSLLSRLTLKEDSITTVDKATKKLILSSSQGGVIHIFYYNNGEIAIENQSLGNTAILSPQDIQQFEALFGITEGEKQITVSGGTENSASQSDASFKAESTASGSNVSGTITVPSSSVISYQSSQSDLQH